MAKDNSMGEGKKLRILHPTNRLLYNKRKWEKEEEKEKKKASAHQKKVNDNFMKVQKMLRKGESGG